MFSKNLIKIILIKIQINMKSKNNLSKVELKILKYNILEIKIYIRVNIN